MSLPPVVKSALEVFEYETSKIVHIHSKTVGILHRCLQLVIVGYLIGFVIVYKKGYQEFDDVESAVTSKVKGVVYTNFTNVSGLDGRIWDVADYVVPPLENGAFFVTTSVLVTPLQRQGICDEDPNIEDALCDKNPCTPDEPVINGNGVKTGECVKSKKKKDTKVCEVRAWCPVGYRGNFRTKEATFSTAGNFTVFIKNDIEFRKFNIKRRNILGFNTDAELSNCRFDPSNPVNKLCPIFKLDKIVQLAGQKFEDVASMGAVIQITITWDCNLDYDESNCLPVYSFRRLDHEDFNISKGFNFRYSDHYKDVNGTSLRTLYKAYGIRFVVVVKGTAGRLGFWPLFLNIGSGIALLSIATLICDIILLYVLDKHKHYKEHKCQDVEEPYKDFGNSKSGEDSGLSSFTASTN